MEMADHTSPLLPQAEEKPLSSTFRSLDDIIDENIRDFSWVQLLQCILVSSASLFDGQQTFITIFTDSEPPWHCTSDATTSCTANANICQLSSSEWGWDGAPSTSFVSEWKLQCAGSVITSLPSSSFFLGSFFGCFFLATLADGSLGRKNLLFLSSLTMSFAAMIWSFFLHRIWACNVPCMPVQVSSKSPVESAEKWT